MVAWSGTPVLCTLFQQPLLSCPFCTNMYDFLPTFNNEAHLNLSEIYFFLTISNQVNQSIHKMCVVNFSEQRALVSNSYLPSPKPGESHPISKSHTKPFHAASFEDACLSQRQCLVIALVFVHNVCVLWATCSHSGVLGISRFKSSPTRLGSSRPLVAAP